MPVGVLLALFVLLLGCLPAVAAGQPEPYKAVSVAVPRRTSADTALRLRVEAGPLPRGARLLVTLPGGQAVGMIEPFGAHAARQGGSYVLPLSEPLPEGDTLTVHVTLEERPSGARRAPSDEELKEIQVLLVPVRR
jgi:hypothetical protein